MKTRIIQDPPGPAPVEPSPRPPRRPSRPPNLAARMGRWSADHWKTAMSWLSRIERKEG